MQEEEHDVNRVNLHSSGLSAPHIDLLSFLKSYSDCLLNLIIRWSISLPPGGPICLLFSSSSPPVLPFQPKSLPEVHFVLIWLQTSVSPPSVGDAFAPSLPVRLHLRSAARDAEAGTGRDRRERGRMCGLIDWLMNRRTRLDWSSGTLSIDEWFGWGLRDAHSCPPHTHLQCGQLPTSQFYLLKPAVWLLNCFYTHNFAFNSSFCAE